MVWHLIPIGLVVLGGAIIIRTIPSFGKKWTRGDYFGNEALYIAVGVVLAVAGFLVWLVPFLAQ